MTDEPADTSAASDESQNAPPRGRRATSVLLHACVAMVLCCGVLSLFLPTIGAPREAARRCQCRNNLKQIGLALQAYEQQYGSLPPAYIADAQGKPLHSWRVLILPFLDQEPLYRQYRFDEPWNGPSNRDLMERIPVQYRCPSDFLASGKTQTLYLAVVGKNTAFPGAKGCKMAELPDDPARTLLVVEARRTGIHWMEPRDLDLESMTMRINDRDQAGIGSMHGDGANALFADGHVEFLLDGMPAAMLRSLLDARDGKPSDKELKELNEP